MTEEQFKDDWNMNQPFLAYCNNLIIEMGLCSDMENPEAWMKSMRKLYRKVVGLIDKRPAKELEEDFKALYKDFNPWLIDVNTREGQQIMQRKRGQIMVKLDAMEIKLITAMHEARLIMPKAIKRTGIKRLEEEYHLT